MRGASYARQQYTRDAVLSASPARLLTMLYDRLLLDLRRAEAAQESADWQAASDNLLHAQDIIAELTATLRPGVWDGADGLRAIYEYVRVALVNANIHRDPERTREAITLLEHREHRLPRLGLRLRLSVSQRRTPERPRSRPTPARPPLPPPRARTAEAARAG